MTYEDAFCALRAERDMWRDKYLALQEEYTQYLKQEVSELKQTEAVLPIPRERKYSEVRRYIEERKRFDEEFKNFCINRSLRDLCNRLTKEFGWFVDEHSLGANLNRNR